MGMVRAVCAAVVRVFLAASRAVLAASFCLAGTGMTARADSLYLSVDGSAWRLAAGDVDGNGRPALIYATYQGAVGCLDLPGGTCRWKADLGGFPFALVAGDVDGDGRDESLVACSDGKLYAFGPNGRPRWTFAPSSAAMNQVVLCHVCDDRPPLIVCGGFGRRLHVLNGAGDSLAELDFGMTIHVLSAVDLDGDGAQELIAGGFRQAWLGVFDVSGDRPRRTGRLPVPRGWFWGQKRPLAPFATCTGRLTGDRAEAMVYGTSNSGGSRVVALGADGPSWIGKVFRGPPTGGFERRDMFCMTLVATGDVVASGPGEEVVAVTTGSVRLYASDGELLGQAHAPVGFTDLALVGRTLYLGSSPNGDDTIYRIDLSGDWQAEVASLRRHGLAKRIGETLATLREQARRLEPDPSAARRGYEVRSNRMRPLTPPSRSGTGEWFDKAFPYPNLTHVTQCGSLGRTLAENVLLRADGTPHNPPRRRKGGYAPEQIVLWARQLEAKGIRCDLHIDHGCDPRITHRTLAKVIEASPSALRGLMSHEDEKFSRIKTYCSRYIGPLCDLCLPAGKEIAMQEKNVWWFAVPAMKTVHDGMLAGGRGRAITAGCDNANSRTPELNLLGRFGLRQAGLIGHIQMSAISDLFCWSRMREWEYPKHGHPYLRVLTAGTVLGADRFYIRVDNLHDEQFTAMTMEGAGLFFHLLGKGVVFAPKPEQMVGVSRVGFAVHEPPAEWLEHNTSGHAVDSWTANERLDNAVVPHCSVVWGNTPTPEHAIQRVLLGKRRQYGAHVPATPYGPIVFVPAHADLDEVPLVEQWWHTDGVDVWREGGERLRGLAAARALKASFESASAKLPFRPTGDDAFFHSVRLAPDRYRIFAIDPGWVDPAERRVTVHVQLAPDVSARDVLSGEALRVEDDRFDLLIPAGALRVIDVRAH